MFAVWTRQHGLQTWDTHTTGLHFGGCVPPVQPEYEVIRAIVWGYIFHVCRMDGTRKGPATDTGTIRATMLEDSQHLLHGLRCYTQQAARSPPPHFRPPARMLAPTAPAVRPSQPLMPSLTLCGGDDRAAGGSERHCLCLRFCCRSAKYRCLFLRCCRSVKDRCLSLRCCCRSSAKD